MKYLCDPHIIPTLVPGDSSHISSYAKVVSEYTNWLHVDIDDGHFESEVSWPYRDPLQWQELETWSVAASVPQGVSLEAHLMTLHPQALGERLARAGFKRLAVHREVFEDDKSALVAIAALRAAGASEVGLALKIDTPLSSVEQLVESCDFIHLMSIAHIGSQGQGFDERALSRVEELHASYPELMVAVDGGISEATVEELVRSGGNRLMVGHALSEASHPAKTYARILERAMRGCNPVDSLQFTVNSKE